MKLIVGLGNPGAKYRNTLHNIGFRALKALADELSAFDWRNKFKSLMIHGSYQGEAYVLLKPQTYMNLSGEAVLACRRFYKIESDQILIISDDIDRPVGSLRYRTSGGHGGHNGLRNIINLCGASFHRLRIGVGRPDSGKSASDYVLSQPSTELAETMEQAIKKSVKYQLDFLRNVSIQITGQRYDCE